MADVNINDLPDASTLGGTELLELLQAGTNVKLTLALLKAFVNRQALVEASSLSGELVIDCAAGRNFSVVLTENITTITFINLPGTTFATEIDVQFKQNATGGFTVALPAAFKALGGSDTAVAAAANAVTVLSAKTFDNGTTWRYAMQESA